MVNHVCIPTCKEFNSCGRKSCFEKIPTDKECWEVNGTFGGDRTCALFTDMKLTDCKNCFYYKLVMKATESVTLLREMYEKMKKEAESQ